MKYISTRGNGQKMTAAEAIIAGKYKLGDELHMELDTNSGEESGSPDKLKVTLIS